MKNLQFYSSGLKFSCKQCSSCCRFDPGFVYLTEDDIKKLTYALKMDRNSFVLTYCRWVTDWKGDEVLSLKEKYNQDCVLWDKGCTVYNARPLQCVTFPFWESNISSSKAWETAASACSGINYGELHSQKEIEEIIKMRDSRSIISKIGVKL